MIQGFTAADVPDQTGRTVFITGANTGLGFEAAKVLAAKGARVLMGCRTRSKAEAARDRILSEHPEAELELIDIDLSNLASVRAAAAVVDKEPKLDVLINNAGVMMNPKSFTTDGFESQLGVNHLGPFALTGLLLEKLEATPNSRVINTSSNGHKMGKMHFDDLEAKASYSKLGRYGQSKLANLLHTYELDRRLRKKTSTTKALVVHPGGSDTELGRHLPGWLLGGAMVFLRPMMNTAASGAWPTLLAATHPDVESGQYFGPSGIGQMAGPARQVDSNALSKDEAVAGKLWDVSVELTGVDPGI